MNILDDYEEGTAKAYVPQKPNKKGKDMGFLTELRYTIIGDQLLINIMVHGKSKELMKVAQEQVLEATGIELFSARPAPPKTFWQKVKSLYPIKIYVTKTTPCEDCDCY